MSQNDFEHQEDLRLRAAILEALQADARTTTLSLRVGVLNRIVHLAGNAPSPASWAVAEEIARAVPGVRGVVNRIEASGAPSPTRTIHLDLDPRSTRESEP